MKIIILIFLLPLFVMAEEVPKTSRERIERYGEWLDDLDLKKQGYSFHGDAYKALIKAYETRKGPGVTPNPYMKFTKSEYIKLEKIYRKLRGLKGKTVSDKKVMAKIEKSKGRKLLQKKAYSNFLSKLNPMSVKEYGDYLANFINKKSKMSQLDKALYCKKTFDLYTTRRLPDPNIMSQKDFSNEVKLLFDCPIIMDNFIEMKKNTLGSIIIERDSCIGKLSNTCHLLRNSNATIYVNQYVKNEGYLANTLLKAFVSSGRKTDPGSWERRPSSENIFIVPFYEWQKGYADIVGIYGGKKERTFNDGFKHSIHHVVGLKRDRIGYLGCRYKNLESSVAKHLGGGSKCGILYIDEKKSLPQARFTCIAKNAVKKMGKYLKAINIDCKAKI